MDQELSQWLHEHQAEIERRWWEIARATGLVAPPLLEQLAREDATDAGSWRSRLLASLAAAGPPDPDWLAARVARQTRQGDLQGLLGALRQALFECLIHPAASPDPEPKPAVVTLAERWRALGQRLDQLGLAIASAFDDRLTSVADEREHWQTLYNLAYEMNSSVDLNYVLQKVLARILEALKADRGAVLLLDPQTGRIAPRAARDWPDVDLNLTDMPPAWQHGQGHPLILKADAGDGSAWQAIADDRAATVIAAPLLANGQFHGVMAVATPDASGFDPRQLGLVEAAAKHMATSVASSQLVQTLRDQAHELGLMLRQQGEESSQREAILASIADGVVVNDERGRIILVNPAAERILNKPTHDLIGRDLKSLFELFTSGAREEILQAMTAILSDPKTRIAPEAAQTALQIDNRIINAHLAPVITAKDEFLGIVTIFRNITKEVEADRAKSEFVSTVSHELRTPMTAIKGYADLIYSEAVGQVNENQKRFLGIIKNNTDRLTAMINDLLDIARIETGRVRFEPEMLKLGEVVANVIDSLAAHAASKGHNLTYRVEAGLPEIRGDPHRLTQVFTNLVSNAINYTPEGGEIGVSVYQVQGALRADVRDNGIGVRPEDRVRIFERFYRADHPLVRESTGTGLGLSIVKMFVEMHGGRVWVEGNEPDPGSTFTLILPLPTEQRRDVDLEQIWSQAAVRLDKHMVLVAEDDRDIAELIRLHLENAGYRVTLTGRGAEALELARRHHPDLLILDILLPDTDGRAVLEALKSGSTTADIPVLILSVVADDDTTPDLRAAGYLTKPVNERELLEAVRMALARRGRILVVEDNADMIEMVRIALQRVGYTVDVAAEGYEALSLARRWRPRVILLDLRLPGMDGYEVLTHLKRSPGTQGIPIIITSAHVADPEEEKKRLKALGVVSFLPKPFTVNQLVTVVDRVTGAVAHTASPGP